MEHASAVAAETKASSESFAMLEAYRLSMPRYHVQVLCTNKLRLYFQRSFRSTKTLTVT